MKVLLSAGLAAAVLTAAVSAQIVTYDGNALPETEGWERRPRSYRPQRWLDDGWLRFQCSVVYPESCVGEDEFYRWNLDDFAGAKRFMLEWSVITDGPRSEILDVAPASCVAAGQRGVLFHTTVASDQVRFLTGVHDPLYRDVQPGIEHVYRLDVYGDYWYEWSVDGDVRDASRPEGPYPTADSFIIWGARAACIDSVTAFDLVRFGIPEEPEIDCDAIDDFTASCRGGTIKVKLKSSLEPGTEVTLTNDGDHRIMQVKSNGKAKAKYRTQTGEHTLLLLNCPAISREVACE